MVETMQAEKAHTLTHTPSVSHTLICGRVLTGDPDSGVTDGIPGFYKLE